MSVLYLNVCRLCVSNIMSLGVCFKKLHLIKVGAFAWYSVKIRVIFVVRFERRKVDKRANLHENWSIQTLFWSILNISAKCNQNRSLQFWPIPFQSLCVFLRHSVVGLYAQLAPRTINELAQNLLTPQLSMLPIVPKHRRNGQAELTWVVSYMPFAGRQMVSGQW